MRKPIPALLCVLVFGLAGCASASGGGGGAHAAAAVADGSVITRNDLDRFAWATAYDIVHRLHPQWLTARGQKVFSAGAAPPQVIVYLGNVRLGGIEELQRFTGAQLGSIQHLDAGRATFQFGSGHLSGAIVLKPR